MGFCHAVLKAGPKAEKTPFSFCNTSSFVFIKAAVLAGNKCIPLTSNINNLSRRERASHMNHLCKILYFKNEFFKFKKHSIQSYSSTVVFMIQWTYISIYFFPHTWAIKSSYINIRNSQSFDWTYFEAIILKTLVHMLNFRYVICLP